MLNTVNRISLQTYLRNELLKRLGNIVPGLLSMKKKIIFFCYKLKKN